MTQEVEDFARLDEDRLFRHQQPVRARSSWWLYGFKLGRLYITRVSDEEEGIRLNFSKYDGQGTVEEFQTIDQSVATSAIKAKLLRQGQSLEEATKRAKHERGGVT